MPNLEHISKGNKKTGCFSFDLPARITCPGMTEECGNDCYAAMTMRIYKNVAVKYARNLELANSPEFVDYMIREIPPNCQFRIHVSGDFKDAVYADKWLRICKARPDVTFYAYTRSWQVSGIMQVIRRIHALLNVNVNLSIDDETGKPKGKSNTDMRWCYLTKTDTVPNWMRPADIIFRSNHNGQKRRRKNAVKKGLNPDDVAPLVKRLRMGVKYEGKSLVCPKEQGQDVPKLSCATCMLCIVKPKEKAYA